MTNLDLALELQAMFVAKFPNQLAVASKGCLGSAFITTFLTDKAHITAHGGGISHNDPFRHSIIISDKNGIFEIDFDAPCLSVNPKEKHLCSSSEKMKGLRKAQGDEKTIKEWFTKFLDKRAKFIALHRDNIKNVDKIDEKYFVTT